MNKRESFIRNSKSFSATGSRLNIDGRFMLLIARTIRTEMLAGARSTALSISSTPLSTSFALVKGHHASRARSVQRLPRYTHRDGVRRVELEHLVEAGEPFLDGILVSRHALIMVDFRVSSAFRRCWAFVRAPLLVLCVFLARYSPSIRIARKTIVKILFIMIPSKMFCSAIIITVSKIMHAFSNTE